MFDKVRLQLPALLIVSASAAASAAGQPPAIVTDVDGRTMRVTRIAAEAHAQGADAGRPLLRADKGFVIRIVGKFMGAPTGAPAQTWEEHIPIRFSELAELSLDGDWCSTPASGGLQIRLRDQTRIVLATAGPTKYQSSSPQPHVIGRNMPIDSWRLQTDPLKVARKKVTGELSGFVGTGADGQELRMPLCQLKRLAFD